MNSKVRAKQMAISFLKELDGDIVDILNEVEPVVVLVEQLYRKYNDWLESNLDISRSEGFKALEKDIKSLQQTCKFLNNDCLDVRHSISDCSVECN